VLFGNKNYHFVRNDNFLPKDRTCVVDDNNIHWYGENDERNNFEFVFFEFVYNEYIKKEIRWRSYNYENNKPFSEKDICFIRKWVNDNFIYYPLLHFNGDLKVVQTVDPDVEVDGYVYLYIADACKLVNTEKNRRKRYNDEIKEMGYAYLNCLI
jgi:hypothetical protein